MNLPNACPKPPPRQPKGKLPIPARNEARAKKAYARAFGAKGEWIRKQRCCLTGRFTGQWVKDRELGLVQVVVVAAHFPSRGAGGRSEQLIPLADHLHKFAHQHSDRALERRFEIDTRALARDYEERWQVVQQRSEAERTSPPPAAR